MPFPLSQGWPAPLTGLGIDISESGITLGLETTPHVVRWLRGRTVLSAELGPWASVGRTRPVPVPVLDEPESFRVWTWEVHKSPRMLLFPESGAWWVVEDADWEVVIACGPPDLRVCLEPIEDEPLFDWLPRRFVAPGRRPEALHVAQLYGLPLESSYLDR